MREFTCLTVFVIVSALFALLMVALGFLCQYRHKNSVKNSTYECGITPFGDAKIRFDVRYFNYAILFLIFDIETIFLYPFAVAVNSLGLFAVFEAFIFLGILLIGLFFVIKRKMLRWL